MGTNPFLKVGAIFDSYQPGLQQVPASLVAKINGEMLCLFNG